MSVNLESIKSSLLFCSVCDITVKQKYHTPNANMAVHSVATQDKLYESKASEASVICFDNAYPEKSCFVVDLVCFISLCLRIVVFLNRLDGETKKTNTFSPVEDFTPFWWHSETHKLVARAK